MTMAWKSSEVISTLNWDLVLVSNKQVLDNTLSKEANNRGEWRNSDRAQHDTEESPSEAVHVQNSKRCGKAAGLHSGEQEKLQMKQRRRSQRCDQHGKWPQKCADEIRDSSENSEKVHEQWNDSKKNPWKDKIRKASRKGTGNESRIWIWSKIPRPWEGDQRDRTDGSGRSKQNEEGSSDSKHKRSKWKKRQSRSDSSSKDEEILTLIRERKTIKKEGKRQICEVSKKIKKCIRDKKRTKKQEKIQKILEESKGTKSISNIKSMKKRILIPKIKNMKGETITSRKGIVVLRKIVRWIRRVSDKRKMKRRTLKKSRQKYDLQMEKSLSIPEFTSEEVQDAHRSSQSSGIKAEHIKRCNSETKEWIRRIFNERVQEEECTPQTWRRIRIKVIHKKGDVEDADNYRSICSLPVLYKLFTTALYARLVPLLDKCQPADQGGFRPNHQTMDDLMVYIMMEQRCREWCVPLYISTTDFMKAFDRIKHSALWTSLEHYRIGTPYIDLLKRLYSHQEGTVLTDKESVVFPIKRDTKQGDPVSSLLFNTVLQFVMEDDLKKWQEKHKDIYLSDQKEDCLTNLRFADRCAAVLHILEQIERHFVRLQEEYGESLIGNSPKQDKDTQQSDLEKTKRGHDRRHQDWSDAKKARVRGISDKK